MVACSILFIAPGLLLITSYSTGSIPAGPAKVYLADAIIQKNQCDQDQPLTYRPRRNLFLQWAKMMISPRLRLSAIEALAVAAAAETP